MSFYIKTDAQGRTIEALALIRHSDIILPHRRKSISHITPPGYHPVKDGRIYILHRTHIIADQLLPHGSSDPKNLITGCFDLNILKMLPLENAVKKYVLSTGHVVRYHVTLHYNGQAIIPHILVIEVDDMADRGSLHLKAALKNSQTGYVLDYSTGACTKTTMPI